MVYGILFKNRIHFEPAPLIIQSLIAWLDRGIKD
jgi:hypothetical protein